ncbi:MAG: ABC transporter ATP-binding protein [Gammaproteobacteria bacterium]|nr:ABC transporter ATP-binding protein [Gammaproteobacteria bacterium]
MYALEISGLEKTYRNKLHALKGVDLKVHEGDFFALLGPNGAGKSTLIGIVSSLVNKSGGNVEIFGHDTDTELNKGKSCLGVVPQEVNFSFWESCMEIVLNQAGYYGISRKVAYDRAEKYFTKLGMWDKRNDRSRTLSGGLKRRLMIARSLMHEPRLLILDEPTAGVDVELRRSMWDFLLEINRTGTTIVLTTHYLEEAETLCRNIAIIDKGNIIEDTSMKTLLGKLNTCTYILELSQSYDVLPEIDDFQFKKIDSMTLEVEVHRVQNLNQLFDSLNNCNIEVGNIRSKSNRLEELFIRLLNNKADG